MQLDFKRQQLRSKAAGGLMAAKGGLAVQPSETCSFGPGMPVMGTRYNASMLNKVQLDTKLKRWRENIR
jgi:hypothetical protein